MNSAPIPFVDLTWQHQPLEDEIKEAITKVSARGDFVLGGALTDFENAFAKACGVDHGVGVASGTSAIALGLQAHGIGDGDEVIVPANTFIATVIGVLQAGARPILVDCDPETALIDLKAAEKAITPRTKAILPVHLYGQMVSPSALLHLARTHGLLVFEDAAQAHLATREGYRAGSVGRGAGFSFYPSKNLGAFGNGGIFVTGEEAIAQKVRALRNYGAPSKYFHTELGTNSRLDTIQAAILGVKLPYLQSWNQQRYEIARYYDHLLAPFAAKGIYPITNESGSGHVYHLYVIRLDRTCPFERQQLQEELNRTGIQTGIHYPIPCHLQPAYGFLGYERGDFPKAENLCQEILSLPMYPGLKEEQVNSVINHLTRIIG